MKRRRLASRLIVLAPELVGGGGIGAVSRAVAEYSAQLGKSLDMEVEIWCLNGDTSNQLAVPAQRSFEGSRLRLAIALLVEGIQRSTVVVATHVHLARPLNWLPAWLRPWLVVIAHGSEATWRIRKASHETFRNARVVLTNSDFTRRRMIEHGVEANVAALGLGLPKEVQLRPEPSGHTSQDLSLRSIDGKVRRIGERALLLVGRMLLSERQKGHEQLLACLPELASEYEDVQMLFVGEGDLVPLLTDLATELGVADRVFMPGYVARDQLEQIYQACCAYVMPSRQEGFGLVYLEAMNHGLPCLACSNDGGAEVVVDGATGWHIADPNDHQSMLSCLHEMLSDPMELRRRGYAGWKRLRDNFTQDHMHERFEVHLRRVLFG